MHILDEPANLQRSAKITERHRIGSQASELLDRARQCKQIVFDRNVEGVSVSEVDGDREEGASFIESDERVGFEEVVQLDRSEEGLDLVLPDAVPFVEGVFAGGRGEELDGEGLCSEGVFGGREDGWD